MKKILVILGFLFTIAASALSAQANTYYVRTNGLADASMCGTIANIDDQAHSRSTINNGLNCLSSGDTLVIHTGTYIEKISTVLGSNVPSGGGTDATRTVIKN